MTATFADSFPINQSSTALATLKTVVVEPALIAAAAVFWVAALPFIAFSLMGVKIFDTVKGIASGNSGRPNPLILRRGLAKSTLTARHSPQTA